MPTPTHDSESHPEASNCGARERGAASVATPTIPGPDVTLAVTGMDCPDEIAVLERTLQPLPGVRGVSVNLIGGTVTIAHDGGADAQSFIDAIAATGMTARLAGTINGEGSLKVRVTKASGDTMLAKIVRLVGEAQAQKAPAQRFVDVFARYYTPAIMVVALLVLLVPPLFFDGAWSMWLYRAVAVDKTGTTTEGKPRVLRVVTFGGKTESEVVQVAAAIDTHSEHPLAKAVVAYAEEKGVTFARSAEYQSRTGRGAEAQLDGHPYFVGNHRFAHELGACNEEVERAPAEIEKEDQSVVVGHKPHDGEKGEVLGILAIGDAIRPNAATASAPSRDSHRGRRAATSVSRR